MSRVSKSSELRKAVVALSLEKFATTLRADFRFAPLNVLVLVALFVAGLAVQRVPSFDFEVGGLSAVQVVALYLGSALALAVLLKLSQVWEAVIVLGTADGLIAYLALGSGSGVLIVTMIVALLTAPAVQIAYQWERAVVLRFGRFQAMRKPGVFVIIPVVDKVAQFVDQRIRVTDFSAETTLTADTVPVSVDAIAFWMVWDAQKAVLEVEHFDEAVVLSAQTALRNAIGRNDLAVLLSERDRLGRRSRRCSTRRPTPGVLRRRPSRSATSSSPGGSKTPCRARPRPNANARAGSSWGPPRPKSPRNSPAPRSTTATIRWRSTCGR